jgi:hypothetical protein
VDTHVTNVLTLVTIHVLVQVLLFYVSESVPIQWMTCMEHLQTVSRSVLDYTHCHDQYDLALLL